MVIEYASHRRGSIKIFVLVGLVLTALAMGTLYGVKRLATMNQSASAAQTETAKTDTPSAEQGDSNTQNTTDNNKQQANSTTDSDQKKQGDTTKSTTEQKSTNNSAGSSSKQAAAQTNEARANDLPKTGPLEDALAVIAALTTTATVAFVKSRRLL